MLKLGPSGTNDDRKKESARFQKTSGFFLSHGDMAHGLADLEAAFALDPENLGLQKQLAGTLVSHALSQANLLANLRIANRAMDLFLEYFRETSRTVKSDSPPAAYGYTTDLNLWEKYLSTFNANAFQDANYLSAAEIAEARRGFESIYEKYRLMRLDIALPKLGQAILHHSSNQEWGYGNWFRNYGFMMLAGLWSTQNISPLVPDEWSRDWLNFFERIFESIGAGSNTGTPTLDWRC